MWHLDTYIIPNSRIRFKYQQMTCDVNQGEKRLVAAVPDFTFWVVEHAEAIGMMMTKELSEDDRVMLLN